MIERPITVPIAKKAVTMVAPTTGSRSMASGMKGSGARARRSAKRPQSSAEAAIIATISGEPQE